MPTRTPPDAHAVYRVVGVDSSPYTAKVRAVMRYRHITHRWICRFAQRWDETRLVRPAIMPMVQFPDGEYRTDSTPIILELEALHAGQRSVIPSDPGFAFLSDLLEDMADEWLAKCLFWHRFSTPEAGEFAARWVADDARFDRSAGALDVDRAQFQARQVARMEVVGVTPYNAPVIEASYLLVLAAMESFVANERFLFGTRPSLGDFGLYSQLRTIGTDPVGLALMRAQAPRTEGWLRRLDDASGIDGEWSNEPSKAIDSLLHVVGSIYLPFLAANQAAKRANREEFEVVLADHPFRARPFGYQVKCLEALRNGFQRLPEPSRRHIAPLLEAHNCLAILSA